MQRGNGHGFRKFENEADDDPRGNSPERDVLASDLSANAPLELGFAETGAQSAGARSGGSPSSSQSGSPQSTPRGVPRSPQHRSPNGAAKPAPQAFGKRIDDDDGEEVEQSPGVATDDQLAFKPDEDDDEGNNIAVEEGAARPANRSLASSRRTFMNAIICFIGTGMYGLPTAFHRVGIIGAVGGMTFISAVSLHCMYLVVDCRSFLMTKRHKQIKTYGDIGFHAFGRVGSHTVDACVMLTQIGFCIAYLIVIAESMHPIVGSLSKRIWVVVCMPVLVRASWLRSLKSLAPLSLLAEIGAGIAAITVLAFDIHEIFTYDSSVLTPSKYNVGIKHSSPLSGITPPDDRLRVLDLRGVPYFFGVCLYTFEGVGMTIPVLNSMQRPENFKFVWGSALALVAAFNIIFGLLGYMAYRNTVADMIISNLPHNHATIVMKVSLSIGLFFTYPLMLFPCIEMMEGILGRSADRLSETCMAVTRWNTARSLLVLFTGVVATMVPKFSVFIGLVGASGGAALAFVLPSAFHLKLRYKEMSKFERSREVCCFTIGVLGGTIGTLSAMADLRAAFHEAPVHG